MNTKIYRQYDGPWAKKPYPTARCTVSGAGCGLVALTHIAIEQDSKKNWTPENLRPYMLKNGYALAGQGTRWEGITETLKHIGHKNVVRIYNDPMSEAWKELNKGNRIGIILFSAGRGGSSGVTWTTCGHYVAFTNYKVSGGKHWFYTKDSGGRKHDGWYSYEGAMKGRVAKMWIVQRIGAPKLEDKIMDACIAQSVHMKNAKYDWESKPTVAKSKYRGTCVTYVACVLQRLGYLKPGEFVWQNGKGYGTGRVYGNNSRMTVTYWKNKPLYSLKGVLKKGDIVLLDDNRSGKQGGGGHIFIVTSAWSGNNPYIWDNETAKKGRKSRVYNGNRKVLATIRLK